jgi:superfamily II RNA helicase
MGDSFTHRPPRRRYDSAFESEASGPGSAATPFKRQRSIKAEDDDDALFVWPDVTATSQSTGLLPPPPQAGLEAVELAEEQRTAIGIIRQGSNVFLTGSAGSGKTMVLNKAVRQLQDLGKRVRKTAPTGKAASNREYFHYIAGALANYVQSKELPYTISLV